METPVAPMLSVSFLHEKTVMVMGMLFTFKVAGSQTGGRYAVLEGYFPEGTGMPILHTHPDQESLYVIEGTFEFYGEGPKGKYSLPASAGTLVHVPSQAPHGVRNAGRGPGRLLMILEPAGNMDQFFEEVGLPVSDGDDLPPPNAGLSLEEMLPIMERYGLRLLEPLPA